MKMVKGYALLVEKTENRNTAVALSDKDLSKQMDTNVDGLGTVM
jgi:hypothetical protein